MKERKSKLDPFAEQLEQWFSEPEKLTIDQARERLEKSGCSVSSGRLSEWWESRQNKRMQDQLLSQITTGAKLVKDVEKKFGKDAAPELETLIKLHRVLILKLSTQANVAPEMVELVTDLMKPVMEFAKLQEKKADRELDERRFQRETCSLFLKWFKDEQAKAIASSNVSNADKIEQLGKKMFGEDWE